MIDASGPYGRFCLQAGDTNRRYLLVATGTGVTPYRAMLPQIRELLARAVLQVALLYGARNEASCSMARNSKPSPRRNPGFTFYGCLSRVPRARAARRTTAMATCRSCWPNWRPSRNDIAYLCGNPDMVDAAFAVLKDSGLPVPHIRREKYVSSR